MFEANYFVTPSGDLIKLPPKQTHIEWIKANYPDDDRESLCAKNWVIIATFVDRHVIQTHGMSYGKLRKIQETLLLMPRKETLVVQTATATAFEIGIDNFLDIDSTEQIWKYKYGW